MDKFKMSDEISLVDYVDEETGELLLSQEVIREFPEVL
jgi:hypothetical protein